MSDRGSPLTTVPTGTRPPASILGQRPGYSFGVRQRYDDPYRNVIAIMINRMLQGLQPIIYGDGRQRRCFSYIDDVIGPLYLLGTMEGIQGEIFNIGPDEDHISIIELAELIADLLDFHLAPIFVPDRPLEVREANCCADKARHLLEYQTRWSLRDGLQQMISWIRKCGPKPFRYDNPIEILNSSTPKTWTGRLI